MIKTTHRIQNKDLGPLRVMTVDTASPHRRLRAFNWDVTAKPVFRRMKNPYKWRLKWAPRVSLGRLGRAKATFTCSPWRIGARMQWEAVWSLPIN